METRIRNLQGTLTLTLGLLFAGLIPATADVYTVTSQGIITNGYDYSGLFGAIGSLDGEAYKFSIEFDSAKNPVDYQDSSSECLYSVLFREASASVTATIGGTSVALPQSNGFGGFCIEHGTPDSVDAEITGNGFYSLIYSYNQQTDFVPASHLNDLSFPLIDTTNLETNGEMLTELRIGGNPGTVEIDTFGATQLTITKTSSVPEPSTLVLMLGGIGILGLTLRCRPRSLTGNIR